MRPESWVAVALLVALPAASALPVLGGDVPLPALPAPLPAVPQGTPSPLVSALPLPQVQVPSLPLPLLPAPRAADPAPVTTSTDAGKSRLDPGSATLRQASSSALLTFLLSAYAAGLDGLRSLAATRPLLGAGRLLRAGARHALRLASALPLAALFSRIEPDHLLDHPVRARLHDAVQATPGLSLQELQRGAGIAWGPAVRHVQRLERAGLVVSLRQGGKRLFFAANSAASRNRAGVAALAQPTARAIADLVRDRPGIDQVGVCAALTLRGPAVSKQLARLASVGLVVGQRNGRRREYRPTPALQDVLLLTPRAATVRAVPRPLRAIAAA